MADILRHPWLERTIDQELSDVLERWGNNEVGNPQETQQNGDLPFEDDGSNLRIASTRPRVAQIVKFMPQESPLQAVLSDSVNRVNATISNDAVQRYTDKARRRLTEGTVGGVIQLLDFEIVATHIGSRANRITLFVTNFKSLGANGSGLHGSQMPQAIEDRPAIRVLIEKLKDYRKGVVGSGLHSKQQTPSKASSLASQLNSPNNASQENQTDFATQAPPPKFHPNITGSPKLPSNDAGWKSRVSKRNVQALVEAEMPRLSNGELEGEEITKNGTVSLHQQNVPINGRKAAPTTEADLLGLIVQAQRGPNNKVATRVSAPAQPSAVSSTRHSPSTVSPTITQPHLLAVDRPSSVSTSRPQPPSISEGPNVPVEDRLDQSVLQASGRESNTSNVSAYARNRISRRDVTISKDQEALLNSSDSWIPAEPGRREPSANIPISILQSLNAEADIRAKKTMSVDGKQDQRSPPDQSGGAQSPINLIDDVQSGQDSESDAPVSASEWPPSPQGPQLPPDSSMESADGHQTPDLQSRKSSFVPVVSQNHRHDRHSRATGSPDHRPLSESRASSAIPNAATPSKTNAGPLRKDDLDSTVDDFNKDHSTQLRNLSSRPSEVYEQGPHDFALGPDHSAFSESPFDLVNRAEHHKKSFNSYSIPSSPASDLEMVIPIPLDNEATHQIFPSTASQPAEPFTQVKRTPYVNGQIYKYPAPGPNRLQSPPHTNSPRLRANGTPIDEVDHVTQSTPFMIETSTSEALPNKAKEGTVIEDVPTDILHADSDMTGTHQKERHPTQSPGHLPERLVKPSEAEKPLPASVIEEKGNFSLPASIPICNRGYDELETKRKASDLDTLSPNVGKRRKRFKVPEALDNIEDLGQRPDPIEGARRFRQDFLASRMVGVPITPQESATTTSASISHIANANVKLSTIGNSEQRATMNLEKHLSPQKGSHLMDVDLESPTNATKGAEPTVPRPGHNAEDDRSNLTADPSSLPGAQDAAPGAQENDGSEVEINGPNKGTNLLGSIDLDKMEQNFFQTERSLGAITASSMPSPHRIQGVETDKYWPQFVTQGASTSGDTPLQGNDFIGIAQSTPTGSTFLDPLLVLDRTPQQTSQPASRLSKKAVSPDISIEKSGVREIRATVPKPLTKSMPAQEPRTLFEKFKITYSAYPGDQKHFIAICKKIQTLLSNDRMEHQSLWDDFIVRHKVEYPHYVRRCAEDAEDPLRYEDFYRTEVERPLYQEGLVTRKTLLEVLSLGDQEKVASEGHDQRKSDIRGKPARSLFEPGKFSFQDQRPFKPASVIDVSGKEGRAIDHKPSDTRSLLNSTNRTKIVSTKGTRRSLPWVDQKGSIKNSNSLESVKSHSLGLPNLGSDRRQRDDHTARELSRSRGPSPLPPTTTAVESRQGSQAGPWWTDENTPFKAFANAYSSIRHGSGNSYAKEKPPTVPNSDSRMRRKTAEVKRVIDPLNWEL